MKVAVLSGKGGTGKTFIAVNLAYISKSIYVDCDVEEPNGYLFFKPENVLKENVYVKIPKVDNEKCNGCRECIEFCKFNALAYIDNRIKIFDDICHSCGGCVLVCKQNAIKEANKQIGVVESGNHNRIIIKTGVLNTGEASGVPIINRLIKFISSEEKAVIDCPPGSACVVMESIKDVDYCILVGEPSIFGAHNFEMVYRLVKLFNKPFGSVLNKCIGDNNPSEKFCIDNNVEILAKIPFTKELATINSDGDIAVEKNIMYAKIFDKIHKRIIGREEN